MERLAITGIGCRLPGADSPEALWGLLGGQGDAIGEIPADRLDFARRYDPDGFREDGITVRHAALIADHRHFDPSAFGLSDAEARALDPQQRWLLEAAQHAFEHAGLAPSALAGSRCGAWIGLGYSEYAEARCRAGVFDAFGVLDAPNVSVARLAWHLDLRGPAIAVDAGCASGLVALHQACAALRAGEVERALVGGVSALVSADGFATLCRAGALSEQGVCRPFHPEADGWVRGEGCVVLVVEPLARAQAEGRPVLAVIEATATGSEGRTKSLLSPSAAGRAALAFPPTLPPLCAAGCPVSTPRPEPPGFLPPPSSLLTVAQARRSASFSLSPFAS